MKSPYLLQRLSRVHTDGAKSVPSTLLVDGKFTEEVTEYRRSVFEFDYMGSAEFEFGTIPACLKRIYAAKPGDFVLGKMRFVSEPKPADPKLSPDEKKRLAYIRRRNKQYGHIEPLVRDKQEDDVYFICRAGDEQGVVEAMTSLRRDKFSLHMKELPWYRSPFSYREEDRRQVGVLDLENDFFVFFVEDTFRRTAQMLGFNLKQIGDCIRSTVPAVAVPYDKRD